MQQALQILLIEDDTIEIMKFNRVLSSLEAKHSITEVHNGEDALELLQNSESLPDIILLDLNMPKMNGIEFLTALKANDLLKFIPTVILTTSNNHRDMIECYKIGIAGYILKPLKYEEYRSKIKALLDYWSLNELKST